MVGCSAPNCKHNSRQKKYKFYRFPADDKRKGIWIKNCNRQNWFPTATSRLCNVHFDESQFEQHRLDGRKLLKPFAIPTLFNVSDESEQDDNYEITPFDLQSDLWDLKRFEDPFKDIDMLENDDEDYKKQLLDSKMENLQLQKELQAKNKELANAKRKIDSLEQEVAVKNQILEQFLSEEQMEKLGKNNKKGKWSDETIQESCKLKYALGKTAYKYLHKSGYPCPSYSTLNRRTSSK